MEKILYNNLMHLTINYYPEYEMIEFRSLSLSLQCPSFLSTFVWEMSRSSGSEHLGGWELRVFYRMPVNLFLGLLARSFRLRRAPASKRKERILERKCKSVDWKKKKKKKKKTRIKRERQTFRNKTEEIYANIFLSKKKKKEGEEKREGK